MVKVLGFGGVGFGPGFMVSGFRVAPNCPQVSSVSSSGFGALQASFFCSVLFCSEFSRFGFVVFRCLGGSVHVSTGSTSVTELKRRCIQE